jgi:hypothetical protein
MERRATNLEDSPKTTPPPIEAVGAPVRTTVRPPESGAVTAARKPPRPRFRGFLAGLGVWLALSALIWPHAPASFVNSVFVGVWLAALGLFADRSVPRLLCGALGAWLALSTLSIVPRTELTFWHNFVIGLLVLIAAFVPSRRAKG